MIHTTARRLRDPDRLAALRDLALLDTPLEASFERLTRMVTRHLGVPVSLITLIDADRQFFKSCVGLAEPYATERTTALSYSFCQYVVSEQQPLVVSDTRAHPLLHTHLAIKDLGVVAYAGVPLTTGEGYVIGALCAIDHQPHTWSADDLTNLTDMAALVMTEIKLRTELAEQQRLQAALRESEQFLRSIYNGVTESIFVLDVLPDGVVRTVSINAAHERTMKMTSAEIQGKTPHQIFVPEVADQIMAHFQACITAGAAITYEESVTFRGERSWWITTLHPLIDSSGRTFRIIGTSTNITSRKNVEEALLTSQHKLLELQRYESMGVLAGGVAHDFNNLLSAMLGNVELAVLELPPASPAVPFLRQTEATARRAADLTRQMLAYAGQVSVLPQRLNLNSLVAEMTHLLHVTIPKQTRLQCDFTIVPPVEADPTQLRQVVMNLVLNAAESIGERPGQIVVTTACIEADAHYLANAYLSYDLTPGAYVALEVADNGSGIDTATQARMFDPFFTTKQNGHGLGLAAVLGIVRRHNGALRVESAPGQGARFTVLLPVADDPPRAPQEQSSTVDTVREQYSTSDAILYNRERPSSNDNDAIGAAVLNVSEAI